mgnify:CR=1 FL=1
MQALVSYKLNVHKVEMLQPPVTLHEQDEIKQAQTYINNLCRDILITIIISTNGNTYLRESRRRVPYLCEVSSISH